MQDWELIIVLTGSRQDKNFLKNYYYHPKIRILNGVAKGIGEAANLALTYSRGEYVIPISPDARLPAQTLETLASYLESNRSIGFVMSGVTSWYGSRIPSNGLIEYHPGNFVLGLIPCAPWMWRRSCFGKTEGFGCGNEFIDLDIALKLEEVGRGAVVIPNDSVVGRAIKIPLEADLYFQFVAKALERRNLARSVHRLRSILIP